MGNLITLYLYNNYSISDYSPIAIRETTDPTPNNALKVLKTLYIYNYNNDIVFDEDYGKNQVVIDWWAQRKNVDNDTSDLRVFSKFSITEDPSNSIFNITTALNILTEISKMSDTKTITQVGQSLTEQITVGEETYSLNWDAVGQISQIMTLTGVTITSITAEWEGEVNG